MYCIITSGRMLRSITGWTEIDFVADDDLLAVEQTNPARAVWTDRTGVARELGTLTPAQLGALQSAERG